MSAPLPNETRELIEERFISAVIKDSTSERLNQCRRLAPEAFDDFKHRKAWREILAMKDSDEAALSPLTRHYLAHPTTCEKFTEDSEAVWLAWLKDRGFGFESEWRDTLPISRSSRRFPDFETEPDEKDVLETTEPIIRGLLEPGDKMSISSGSKSYKTWLLIQLAYAIQSGTHFLGFETKKCRVLFLNFEIKPRNFWKRVFSVRRALGHDKSADFTVWNLRGTGFSMDRDVDELVRRAKTGKFGVIVLDPVYKLFGDRNESSAGDMASLMALFDKVATETAAAIVYAHHFAKGNAAGKDAMDRQSGSGVFARDPDCLVSLTRLNEDECPNGFAVDVTLRDFAPVDRFSIRRQHPLMVRDDSLNSRNLHEAGGRQSKYSADALAKIIPDTGVSVEDWKQLAKSELGMSRSTFFDYAPAAKKLARTDGKLWFQKGLKRAA